MLNGIQAFIQRKEPVKHDPFAVMSHERQIELAAAHEFHAGKLGLERWRNRRGARASVGGNKVEGTSVPFRRYVDDVVEPGLLRWRLNEFGLQHRLHEPRGFASHMSFEVAGDG